jgi:hypothetical protein
MGKKIIRQANVLKNDNIPVSVRWCMAIMMRKKMLKTGDEIDDAGTIDIVS